MSNKNLPTVKLVALNRLKAHEATSPARSRKVQRQLFRAGLFTKPILIDKKTKVILDGHHRSYLLKKLGYKKIPALLLSYHSRRIKVKSRRRNIKVAKNLVLARARRGQLFPYKTTKHLLPYSVPKINYHLSKLK